MSSFVKNFILFIVVFLLLSLAFSAIPFGGKKIETVGIEKMVAQLQNQEVKKIEVSGDSLTVTLKDGKVEQIQKESGDTLSGLIKNYNIDPQKMKDVEISVKNDRGWAFWLGNILPFVLPIVFFAVFIYYMTRQAQGANARAMGFGQTSAQEIKKDEKTKVTFKDVAGCKEAKEELKEVVEFLSAPKRFVEMGAKIPKGVLLMGAPGTGKTLLAKAVAGEANVPFYHISGSEFVEMFVGVGASRVRDLFRKAKKSAPAIVFIDEIDAVGRRRGTGLGGSHDEREQTLNQILVEMDGFEPNSGVIVVAATNRPDVLDPALLRPGRFDRRVVIDEPDLKDREEILQVHAKGKIFSPDVSLRRIAERTPGFTGADLANLLNEAAILAVRKDKKQIDSLDILESVEKVMLGPERRSRLISDKEKKITAYHEAGHALVAHLLPHTDPVRKVSIIARGRAGGYTLKMPLEDKRFISKIEFEEDLAVSMAGFVAEREIFGPENLSTGPSADLRQATHLARRLVTEFGMSEKLGPRTFGEHDELIFLGREITEQRDYSEKVAELIDEEVSRLIAQGKGMAEKIIREKRQQLDLIVQKLMEKETIEQDELVALLGQKVA